jgi:hypothetical protein
MRWVTLTAGFILVAAAHGALAQPSFDMPGRISATSYHALSLPGRITVVASDDNPVDVAVARRITDELARQGHGGIHPVAATLTFQTEVRREWHGGMTSARDSGPDPAGLPDLDERRHEGASVEAELPVGRLPLETAPPRGRRSTVPVYVLTATLDTPQTGQRLWQCEIAYRGAIATDDTAAFAALIPRLVENIGRNVRDANFQID